MSIDLTPLPWMASALCAQIGGDAWFPEIGEPAAPAKSVCQRCPTLERCREYADDVESSSDLRYGLHGVWAAESPRERQQRRRRQLAA